MVDLPPTEVDVVVVQPPRLAPLGGDSAFDTVQIDAASLRRSPRLDEALRQAPGVSLFRRNGSSVANPTTQGMSLRAVAPSGAGRALVTLDGAPVNDPFGGWVIWTALPPEGLAGATIVRGAGAGPYGAGALTGVVALREADAADGLAALELTAAGRGGLRAAAAGGGPGVLLTAAAETSRGYTPVRGARRGAADIPLSLNAVAFSMRAQRVFDGVESAVRLGVFQERRGAGLVGARSTASGASATITLARRTGEGEGVGGWRLQLWARASDLANTSVAVAASRATTTPANDQYSTPASGFGLNAALQGRAGAVAWEAGVDGRLARGVDRENFRVINGVFTMGREAGGETSVAGAYVEGLAAPGPWLVTGGVRLDAWRADDAVRRERSLASGAITLDNPAPGSSGTTPTARLGVRRALGPGLWLRSAAYAGFRPPTLNELHRPFRVGNDVTEANPALKPERLKGIEAGLGGDGGGVRWSATLFRNRLRDPVTNVTIGGPGAYPVAGFIPPGGTLRQRRNAGEIRAWGVEGEAAGEAASRLAWRAAFSWTRARVDGGAGNPQLAGKRPAQAPRLTLTGGVEWRPTERLGLGAEVLHESARFEDDLNSRVLKAATQVDLRAAWRLFPGSELYLAVENVADADIATGQTADGVTSYGTPRTVSIGFSFRR